MAAQPNPNAHFGPTSTAFILDIANTSLARMGIQSTPEDDVLENQTKVSNIATAKPASVSRSDGLPAIELGEVMRLINVYQDTFGTVYPCLDIEIVKYQAMSRWDGGFRTKPNSTLDAAYHDSKEYASFDRNSEILKVVLAIALVHEGNGYSAEGAQLMRSAEEAMYRRMTIVEVDLKELLLFTLMVRLLLPTHFSMLQCNGDISRVFITSKPARRSSRTGQMVLPQEEP